jgi:hypothetical protein
MYAPDWGSAEYKQKIRLRQIFKILEEVNIVNMLEGLPAKVLMDVA